MGEVAPAAFRWHRGAMWIQTSTFGFVSVVLADTAPGSRVADPEHVMLRARCREHLEALQHQHPALRAFPISQSAPGLDYPWRIAPVPKAVAATVIAEAVNRIDYRNFKAACSTNAKQLGVRYEHLLHDVWSVLLRLQRDR